MQEGEWKSAVLMPLRKLQRMESNTQYKAGCLDRSLENSLIVVRGKAEYMHQNIVCHIWCGGIWKLYSGYYYFLSEIGNNQLEVNKEKDTEDLGRENCALITEESKTVTSEI